MKTRIIIWGLSETGLAVARSALTRSDLHIVAALACSPEQEGRDIGELLGMQPIGINASTDESALLKCEADCVVITPPAPTPKADINSLIIRLLESGRNVISNRFCSASEEDLSALQTACQKGNTSVHTTGLFPQLLLERFALTLSKALQRVEHVRVVQAIDCRQAPPDLSEELNAIGLGQPEKNVPSILQQRKFAVATAIRSASHQLFDNTNDIRVEHDVKVTPATVPISDGNLKIDTGCAAAISFTHRAWRGNHCFLSCEEHWFMGPDYTPPKDIFPYPKTNTPFNFSVRVEGHPGLLESQLELEPVEAGINPLAHVAAQGILAAIQPICTATPGILVNDARPCYQLDDRMPSPRFNARPYSASGKKSRYRVVIWGPGEIGGAVTRAALLRDNIDIVGAKVFSPHKHGKDLGELVGINPIGIKATTSKEAIKALKPDCIIVTPQPRAIVGGLDDDVLELLESGINVITSAAYHNVTMPNWLVSSQTPSALLNEVADTTGMARNRIEEIAFAFNARMMKFARTGPQRKLVPPVLDQLLMPVIKKAMPFRATPKKIQGACHQGGVSLHGTGVHPTFMAERIGIQLASLIQQPQHMRFIEAADFSYMPDGMWGGLTTLGFGVPVDQLDERYLVARAGDFYYGDVTGNVAHLLFGVPSTEVRLERAFRALPAERDFKVGSIVIKKGCAAALHMTHKGFIGDHHFFTNEECWYLGPEVEYRGDNLPFGNFRTPISYTIDITEKANNIRMQLSMDGTGKAAEMMSNTDTSTADQRCALGQSMRQAGITNPITNATAMSILDAVGPVCDMAPGVVIDDIRPQFRHW